MIGIRAIGRMALVSALLATPAARGDAGASDVALDYSTWAADATKPGSLLPATGRSLFDFLFTEQVGEHKIYRVPFPFTALIERIQRELGQSEYGGGTRIAMIPMGRSLQRSAAAPDFFKHPRKVFAVTGEPRTGEHNPGMLLKDRLYLGYVETTNTIEVISYNEAAGRFEFQLVKDYRAGAEPKVFYANRAICISCHQNHAPIFSKAVWSESNANSRVADLLSQTRADFYDLPPQANLDFPDDIGQATVRANALVTQQTLWQRGCESVGDPAQSRRCRAAALVALMQYALSGELNLGAGAPGYQTDFVTTFGNNWRQRWPQGLSVAQGELPDRSPLGGGAYRSTSSEQIVTDFIAAAHVPAELDPLNPRPPRETWRFGGALDAYRYIVGWSRFFASADFRTLDTQLLQRGRASQVVGAPYASKCVLTPNPHSPYQLKIDCEANGSQGFALRGRITSGGSGLVDLLNLGPTGQIRDTQLEVDKPQREGDRYMLRAALQRKGLSARLADGRAITDVVLRWPVAAGADLHSGTKVGVELLVVNDFGLLRQAVDELLREQPHLFDNVALQRTGMLRALHAKLDFAEQAWCCGDEVAMPPAVLESAVGPDEMAPQLQPFYHNCATCHLTAERFPPNFLAGSAKRVDDSLRRCAPRMLVRLSAWHQTPEQRAKSPMPPPTFLPALGATPEQWRFGEEFLALRNYVEGLVSAQGRSTQLGELLKDGYEALPSCLPEATEIRSAHKN